MLRDIDITHRRRWPDRPITLASRLCLLVCSSGSWVMLIHRAAHWLHTRRMAGGRKYWRWRLLALALAPTKWVVQIRSKTHVNNDSRIAPGVCFSDQGHIIFGAVATGAGTVIGPRVTIGMSLADTGRPVIGANVWIGPDCVICGAITIGDGATLLPGAVLTKSIPPRAVVRGNPARVVGRDFDNSDLRERAGIDPLAYFMGSGGKLNV